MMPNFLRNARIYVLSSVILTVIGLLGFSFAFFNLSTNGNMDGQNTIMVKTTTEEDMIKKFTTIYDDNNSSFETGILNINQDYQNIMKFKVQSNYNDYQNITINWHLTHSTLNKNNTSYYLFSCIESNYEIATTQNVSSLCTTINPNTGNFLPETGKKTALQNSSYLVLGPNEIQYYIVLIIINESETTKSFSSGVSVNHAERHLLTLELVGGYISTATSMFLTSGESIIIPYPRFAGHIFNGWLVNDTDAVINDQEFTMGTSDAILTATWIDNNYNYAYSGVIQNFTVPLKGYYYLTAKGARGGIGGRGDNYNGATYGNGGYVEGIFYMNKNDIYKIYVGGVGNNGNAANLSNGGGGGAGGVFDGFTGSTGDSFGGGGAGGGGSTTITKNNGEIILSAYGGGGGAGGNDDSAFCGGAGGNGGKMPSGTTTRSNTYVNSLFYNGGVRCGNAGLVGGHFVSLDGLCLNGTSYFSSTNSNASSGSVHIEYIGDVNEMLEEYNSFFYTYPDKYEFITPKAGYYVFEVYGARGGIGGRGDNSSSSSYGNGGYVKGVIYLEENTSLELFVGSVGLNGGNSSYGGGGVGGWNGGGSGSGGSQFGGGGGGGGGQSVVRLKSSSLLLLSAHGGGGGAGGNDDNSSYRGGAGGGGGGGTLGGSVSTCGSCAGGAGKHGSYSIDSSVTYIENINGINANYGRINVYYFENYES